MKFTIRQKLILFFLCTTLLMAGISFYTFFNAKILSLKMNTMFKSNVSLNNLKQNLNDVSNTIEKYLETNHYMLLNDYLIGSTRLKNRCAEMNDYSYSGGSHLLLEDIQNMIHTYLNETDAIIQSKRGRDINSIVSHFNESIKISGYINNYIEKLNNQELQDNTERYLAFSKRMDFLQFSNILAIIFAVFLNIVLVFWFSFILTNPIVKLSLSAEKVAEGDFNIEKIDVDTNDEIGITAAAFNRMISSIKIYINEIKGKAKLQNLLKEAELKALQAQIHPHFIFNTLNAGTQLAVLEGADKTAAYIENVAKLVRYSLRKFDEPVKLDDEIKNIETYIFILKTRFTDRISYKFRMEAREEVLNLDIPCMTLQPLIENAYMHGIGEIEGGGLIELTIREKNGKAFWERSIKEKACEKIKEAAGYSIGTPNSEKHLGAVIYDCKPDGSFKYMIMADIPEGKVPDFYEILEIPKMTWAVMTETKPIQEMMDVRPLWKRLPEFFEATGYEHADAPSLEQYAHNKTHRFGEIWIPIIKKDK